LRAHARLSFPAAEDHALSIGMAP